MPGLTVILCPPLGEDTIDLPWRETEATLRAWGYPVVAVRPMSVTQTEPPDARMLRADWVSEQSIALARLGVSGRLILVCGGRANTAVPALGFAQRAARRSVIAYVLCGGVLPHPARDDVDWPDAPVTYVARPGSSEDQDTARAAELRGWDIRSGDCVEEILAVAQANAAPHMP